MVRRSFLAACACASLAGCTAPLAPEAFDGATPQMRPEAFFLGGTVSAGVLENRSGEPTQRFHVEGEGQLLPDGSLQLVQHITFDSDPPTTRTWVLQRVDDHRYAATLTDASGPVHGEAYGNVFHLSYPMKTPPLGRMEQWLYLQPDGRTVVNEATISLLGVTVARLSERITHRDAP